MRVGLWVLTHCGLFGIRREARPIICLWRKQDMQCAMDRMRQLGLLKGGMEWSEWEREKRRGKNSGNES